MRRLPGPAPRQAVVQLKGRLSGTIEGETSVSGEFSGELDLDRARLEGSFKGGAGLRKGKFLPGLELRLEGCLEPWRHVHFTQWEGGKRVGGITVQLKLPRFRGQANPEEWR